MDYKYCAGGTMDFRIHGNDDQKRGFSRGLLRERVS
jgi:hypothetical protein